MNIQRLFLAKALLTLVILVGPTAQPVAAGSPIVFGEGYSISRLFSSLNNRTRIVQFCAGAMALGLFIMIKKLAPGASAWPAPRASENEVKLPRDPKRS